jgi:glutamate carboxypeptidase
MTIAQTTPILAWLGEQESAMLALLEQLVNTDSGTYDKAGVDAVGTHIRHFLAAHGITCEKFANDRFGDGLRASVGEGSSGTILLMGHRDTVFPKGEAGRRPFRVADHRAHGPGVADMKAGLTMNAFVLAALAKFGGAPGPVVGLFTADEEIGSPSSRALIEAEARRARAVFNSEPGRPNDAVVTGRKGGVFMHATIAGKAAHSGTSYADGISAIEELARKITALHALTDLEKGVTINVGIVSGGQSVNTIAPSANCDIDLRFVTPADRATAMTAIEQIIAHNYVAGTASSLEVRAEFLPLVSSPQGDRLFRHYAMMARDLGIEVTSEFAGGCADSGFAAATGAPTLCAVGPIGARGHTPEEYLELSSLVKRAQILMLAIMRLDAA